MLLTILSGCEELSKPDYITVNVICDISVYAQYANDPNSNQPVVDALVNVEIVKAGGERVTKKLKTDSLGNCESVTATFKLYRDQPIAAIAAVLYPAETDYLYFVSKDDTSHHFSRTLKEHNRAVHNYRNRK